ncbi:glycosyltransferase family 4 protein [bacterium]|nr:glycosyltransferase family 4 protein [bacterium]
MRIAFIGNLAGNAYIWSKLLRKKGLSAELFISNQEWKPAWEDKNFSNKGSNEWIHIYDNTIIDGLKIPKGLHRGIRFIISRIYYHRLLLKLLEYDIVHSFTGSLFMSRSFVSEFGIRHKRPYIASATGSDIREMAFQEGRDGRLMRLFFQQAAKTLLLNLDMVDFYDRLSLKNAEFFPFMIDTQKYCVGNATREYSSDSKTLFFMASHLDWGVVDNANGRKSTKGNDRFIKAFARYLKDNGNAHAFILDRGPDKMIARQLVSQMGISSCVTFLPEMQKDELIKHFRLADVVVDQFDVGAFGTTALEAMSCAKPVMIYIKNQCADKCYPERAPILNAQTEDEIYVQIKLASNRTYREEIGQKAREWIMKYHDWEIVSSQLINIYEEVIYGRKCQNYYPSISG